MYMYHAIFNVYTMELTVENFLADLGQVPGVMFGGGIAPCVQVKILKSRFL